MPYLISEIVVLALIGGFIALTRYEDKHDMRFFSVWRSRLDHKVERIVYTFTHVDVLAFLREEIRHLAIRIGHDITHLSLLVVRAIERLLTRLMRRFRTSPALDTDSRQNARDYVKTLSEFKDQLNATHPEISDIEST